MSPHVDILGEPESLKRWLVLAIALHVGAAGVVVGLNVIGRRTTVQWGELNGGGPGAVAVSVVNTIPLQSSTGPANPLANDTHSALPEPPVKTKPAPRVKAPDPAAIPIKSRNARTRESIPTTTNKLREKQDARPNQVTSTVGQSLSSPMYQVTG